MDRNFGGNRGNRPTNRDSGFGNAPPVQVGEEINVRIEAVGEKGDGVAKKNGFVIFVPGVKEGQDVRVKVTRVLRKVGFGEVIGAASAPVETNKEAKEEVKEDYSSENDSDDFGDDAEIENTNEDSESFGDEEENK